MAHAARRAVIDWHAALFPGLHAPATQTLARVLADDLDRGNARLASGRAHYRHWHNTGTIGTIGTIGAFGATAAAAALRQLDEQAFAHALAIAATCAAGLGTAMSDGPSWDGIADTLGRDFHITRLTFKNHVGCGHTFPAIDGALELQRLHGFGPADIAAVHLGVYQPTLDIAPHVEPQTADQARFSLHSMVASALVHGSVRLSAFEPARLQDPATRALMRRITKALDPQVDAGFPQRRAARVTITLHDGRRFTHWQSDRKGDPELPLTDADLEDKLLELASPVIGAPSARALLERLWALDTCKELP